MYTVLWFDIKYGHGVAEDAHGNEYYIDNSCCPADLKAKDLVEGVPHVLGGTSCLKSVKRVGAA